MGTVRVDAKTGKKYDEHNIPIMDGVSNTVRLADGTVYKIISESSSHPEDCWYNGQFIGDRYCVATLVRNQFWQQVSRYYVRYGDAINKMKRMANMI